MSQHAKYIIFDGDFFEYPVIFPEAVKYYDIASGIKDRPISAGFVVFLSDGPKTYGRSYSLKLSSKPEDIDIIRKTITGVENG